MTGPRRSAPAVLGSLICLYLCLVTLADGVAAQAPAVTVLLHHPYDQTDPFGFPYVGAADYFAARYGGLVADKGRFDYPFFVADGIVTIERLPDPARPYVSALDAYGAAIAQRTNQSSPVVLELSSTRVGDQIQGTWRVNPRDALAGESLHLMLAVVEDHIEYLPLTGLTNGVKDHRFTVRAVVDAGELDLADASARNGTHTFVKSEGWKEDRLSVAAWVQAAAPGLRFDAREVVQATHAVVGAQVRQESKGVLVEMLSATWCEPCLYGDLAVEDLAVQYGITSKDKPQESLRYFAAPRLPLLVAILSVLGGWLVVRLAGRGT